MSDAIVTAVKHVRSITVATANGVSGSVTTTPTPIITITLGAITPSSIAVSGNVNVNGAITTTNWGVNSKDSHIAVTGSFSVHHFGVGTPSDVAAGNYEMVAINHSGTSGIIRMLQGGTGVYRPLIIQNSGSTMMTFTTSNTITLGSGTAFSGAMNFDSIDNSGILSSIGNINVNSATNTTGHGINVKDKALSVTGTQNIFNFGVGTPSDLAAGNYELLAISHQGSSGDSLIRMLQGGTGAYRNLSIQNNGATQLTFVSTGGITAVTALTASSTLATTGLHTASGGVTVSSSSLTLSGNISSAAWTTSGLRIKGLTATFTDTTSSGTVATAYTDTLGGNTIAASSVTTFTEYDTVNIADPIAGSNVTMTSKWALNVASLKFTGRLGGSTPQTIASANVQGGTGPTAITNSHIIITGTTNFSRFETAGLVDRTIIFIRFTGILTIGQASAISGTNYGIRLPGSAGYTTSNHDTLTLMLDLTGGFWYTINRTLA